MDMRFQELLWEDAKNKQPRPMDHYYVQEDNPGSLWKELQDPENRWTILRVGEFARFTAGTVIKRIR